MLVVHRQTETDCQVTHILHIEVKKKEKRDQILMLCILMKKGEGGKVNFFLYMPLRKPLLCSVERVEDHKGSNNGL